MKIKSSSPTRLLFSFVGPQHLLVVRKNADAMFVDKHPVESVKRMKTCNCLGNTFHNSESFVAREYQLQQGEYSQWLMEHCCYKFWVLVSGLAWVTHNKVTRMLTKGKAFVIPPMEQHRIYNSSAEPIRLVEVNSRYPLSGEEEVEFVSCPARIGSGNNFADRWV